MSGTGWTLITASLVMGCTTPYRGSGTAEPLKSASVDECGAARVELLQQLASQTACSRDEECEALPQETVGRCGVLANRDVFEASADLRESARKAHEACDPVLQVVPRCAPAEAVCRAGRCSLVAMDAEALEACEEPRRQAMLQSDTSCLDHRDCIVTASGRALNRRAYPLSRGTELVPSACGRVRELAASLGSFLVAAPSAQCVDRQCQVVRRSDGDLSRPEVDESCRRAAMTALGQVRGSLPAKLVARLMIDEQGRANYFHFEEPTLSGLEQSAFASALARCVHRPAVRGGAPIRTRFVLFITVK